MTPGHRHRTIRVGPRTARILQHPLIETTSRERAEKSRWTWGEWIGNEPVHRDLPARSISVAAGWCAPESAVRYRLTLLGILHTLFGLTLEKP